MLGCSKEPKLRLFHCCPLSEESKYLVTSVVFEQMDRRPFCQSSLSEGSPPQCSRKQAHIKYMDRNKLPFLCHSSPLSLSNLFRAVLKLLLLVTLTQASPATRVHRFSVIALDVYPAPCLACWQAPEGLLLISSARSRLADWIEMLLRLSGHADVSGENSLKPRDHYLMLQLNLLAWSHFHPLL